jgi:plasmid stabilization system protein ParE
MNSWLHLVRVMEIEYHPSVQKDIRDALAYFDRFSDAVGDKVFKDFRGRVEDVRLSPLRFPPFEDIFRKAPLKQYPFDVVYRIVENRVRILVFRHQERHPDHGLHRR